MLGVIENLFEGHQRGEKSGTIEKLLGQHNQNADAPSRAYWQAHPSVKRS